MSIKLNNKYFLIILINLLILCIFCESTEAINLEVNENNDGEVYVLDDNNNQYYDQIIVHTGGTLKINSSDIVINTNELQIDGNLTYHEDKTNDDNMNVTINVDNNASITGLIDFKGADGSNGTYAGVSGSDDGSDGEPGESGKNIKIEVAQTLTINGDIDTRGGNGGNGGDGHDDDSFWNDPIGDGGDGGTGGNGGKIQISAANINISSTSLIQSDGGVGGNGGDGGDAGTFGYGGSGGNGANGGNAGEIYFNKTDNTEESEIYNNSGDVLAKGGSKGYKGYGDGGSPHGSDGLEGYPGQIDITAKYFDNNNGNFTGTGRTDKEIIVKNGYGAIQEYNFNPDCDLRKDTFKPEIPINIELVDSNNNALEKVDDKYYTNDTIPSLKWDVPSDNPDIIHEIPASDIKEYHINLTGNINKSLNTVNLEIQLADTEQELTDGTYEVNISALDNANNESDKSINHNLIIDTDNPLKPQILLETISENNVTLNWKQAMDNNHIGGYEIKIYENNQDGSENIIDTYIVGQNQTSQLIDTYNGLSISPNQTILYKIRTIDVAGNKSSWNYDKVVTAPEVVTIIDNQSGWDGNNHYFEINFDSCGNKVDSYKYIRKKKVINDGVVNYILDYESNWFQIGDVEGNNINIKDTGTEVKVNSVSGDSLKLTNKVDNNLLEAHGEYKCFIKTKNSSVEDNIDNTQMSSDCNILINNQIPVSNGIVGPVGVTLNSQTIDLTVNPFVDKDGDLLTYSFYLAFDSDNDGQFEESEYELVGSKTKDSSNYYNQVTLEVSNIQEGSYKWYCEVDDEYVFEAVATNKYEFSVDFAADSLSPEVNIYSLTDIYKGKQQQFSAAVNSQVEITDYLWNFGDNNTSSSISPLHSYLETGTYTVSLTCTDINGKQGSDSITVDVINTLAGEILLDETLSNSLELRDEVIIPEDITLTITAGSTVSFSVGDGLIVDGTLQINGVSGNEVLFTCISSDSNQKWKGIKINDISGTLELKNVIIERAERGIILNNKNLTLNNVKLLDNNIGLHMINSSPTISDSEITNNKIYGIKEDGNCQPDLSSNTFSNNQVADYYDSVLTLLSASELNQ